MKNIFLALNLLGGFFLAACGGSDPQNSGPDPTLPGPDPTLPGTVSSYQAGLQSSGAIGFALASDSKTRLEFSAPITPRTDVLYAAEGAKYPSAPADQAALAHNASLTFKFLLSQCAADYPGTKQPTSDAEVLSAPQLNRNFNAVAQCAYEKFTAKPYWIPQLINDVDICATELGSDWRLPTEADVTGLKAEDIAFLGSTLTDIASGTGMMPGAWTWGSYYFSLTCYVRGSDGTLKLGDLGSGVADRVTALGIAADQYKDHLEHLGNPLSLRCVRRTKLS